MENAILELAKLTLQLYFLQMQVAGKTDEEAKKEFDKAKTKFMQCTPDKLK